MIHHVCIRHLVRFSKRDLDNRLGHEDVMVENPANAFEPRFWCGFVNGTPRKYHDHAILKRLRVIKEIDRDGKTVDERTEEILS